jgi:hypothetical protein
MNLVAAIPTWSVPIWRNITSIVTIGMKPIPLSAALSATEARAQEEQHSGCEHQSKNAQSEQYRAVHMLRPSSFLALSRYH